MTGAFHDFSFAWTYEIAADIRRMLCNHETEFFDAEEFFRNEETQFDEACLKPNKITHLHRLVSSYLCERIIYLWRKTDFEDELEELLTSYKIEYLPEDKARATFADSSDHPEDWKYSDYLSDIALEKIVPLIANEVFTLLFQDRELCQTMNEIIAKIVINLEKSDYPELLEKDGVIVRNTSWQQWVKNALMCRDKGRCAYCLRDITGVVAANSDFHIDHIIPLKAGGSNDPTNLQILCKDCNLQKGAGSRPPSKKQLLYWDMD